MNAIPRELSDSVKLAAEVISSAGAVLIGAGAGMGVDSGLPDFRGNEGFWNAYPVFRERGLSFVDLANPQWFKGDPSQAWGFYGHRLLLYRRTQPHTGFSILAQLAGSMPGGAFVFTSNVDGHFQKAGFPEAGIVECHGSIHHLQCAYGCTDRVWSARHVEIEVDESACRAIGELPSCPECGRTARPNILMFGDWQWVEHRTTAQDARLGAWLRATRDKHRIAKIELGAGMAVPTVRSTMERLPGTLIRINPRECSVPAGAIAVQCGAREAIARISEQLSQGK